MTQRDGSVLRFCITLKCPVPGVSIQRSEKGEIVELEVSSPKDGHTYIITNSPIFHQDGSISKNILSDGVHPAEAGYEIWAQAMEPRLEKLLLSREKYQTGRRTDHAVEAAATDRRPISED